MKDEGRTKIMVSELHIHPSALCHQPLKSSGADKIDKRRFYASAHSLPIDNPPFA